MTQLAAALLVGLALQAWALTICQDCGHEATEGETTCGHCGTALPKSKPDADSTVPRSRSAGPVTTAAAGVGTNLAVEAFDAARADVQAARAQEATRVDLALASYENALSLLALAGGTSQPVEAGGIVVASILRCRRALGSVLRDCVTCRGSGKMIYAVESLTAERGAREAAGPTCRTCGGSGEALTSRSSEDLRVILLQARREFALLQQGAGRAAVGRVWVPAGWPARLTARQTAALRRANAEPCNRCVGFGETDCTACKGIGRVACTARGCRQGWVERQPSNTLTPKSVLKTRAPCPNCQGAAQVACLTCHGDGRATCPSCNGSGQSPRCRACGGEGLIPCRRCRGARIESDGTACRACGGEGVSLCATCRGDGCAAK